MEEVVSILDNLEKITLEEMDGVKLMDRVDVKYLVSLNQLGLFLKSLQMDYKVLEIANTKICQYETLYYDTPQLDLYKKHLTGRTNRYKIRHRRYVDTETSFFEVKFKNNKGRTFKSRELSSANPSEGTVFHKSFLEEKTPFRNLQLQDVLWVLYKRITLVSKYSKERITIDLNLTFKDNENCKSYNEIVIVEIKQDSSSKSIAKDILKSFNIRAGSLSKYCLGIISVKKGIKYNRFRTKVKLVNTIINKYANQL